MSDYPEALVEKVAAVILDNFNPPDDKHPSWWINPEKSAVAVLDALGLRKKEERGVLEGNFLVWDYSSRARKYTSWWMHTPWEEDA